MGFKRIYFIFIISLTFLGSGNSQNLTSSTQKYITTDSSSNKCQIMPIDSVFINTSGKSNYIKINNDKFQNTDSLYLLGNQGKLIQTGKKNIINISTHKNPEGSKVEVKQTGSNNKVTIRQNSKTLDP